MVKDETTDYCVRNMYPSIVFVVILSLRYIGQNICILFKTAMSIYW